MASCQPAGGDSRKENQPKRWATPRFWLAAGAADGSDVAAAKGFWQQLRPRQPGVPLTLTPGGGHSMPTWRAEVPAMLSWMTPGLAGQSPLPPSTVLAAKRSAALR